MRYNSFLFTIGTALLLFACSGEPHNTDPIISEADSAKARVDINGTNAGETQDFITGTYTFGSQDGEGSNGYLALQALQDGTLKFELDLNMGAPRYHSGTATGIAKMEGNKAVWRTTEFAEECVLVFTMGENTITVRQEQGTDIDCGFGAGVMADGVFNKTSNEPVFKYEDELNATMEGRIIGTYAIVKNENGKDVVYQLEAKQTKDDEIALRYTIDYNGELGYKLNPVVPFQNNNAGYRDQDVKSGIDCKIKFAFSADGNEVVIKQGSPQNEGCQLNKKGESINATLPKVKNTVTF